MILLLDIGNTHTHLGWADTRGVRKTRDLDTTEVVGAGSRDTSGTGSGPGSPPMRPCARSSLPRLDRRRRHCVDSWDTRRSSCGRTPFPGNC